MAILHWDPDIKRTRGLGENLQNISCKTFFVSNLKESLYFYHKVLRFKILEENETSATLDCKNMVITIRIGTPITFSGDNLIVSHVSVDVIDVEKAFDYLHVVDVPFEINVSVSLGGGLSYAEGGGLENTVGQAFLRDPDGYYFEICNCHLLTDFVLGNETNFNPDVYKEDNVHVDTQETLNLTWNFSSKLAALAVKAKKNVAERKKSDPTQKVNYISPLPLDKQPKEPDATILENFIQRKKIYSSICQSFSDEEIKEILLQSGNNAPVAVLLMKQKIDSGEISRIYQPPAYFVNDIDDDQLFKPNALTAGADEKGKDQEAPELTAGEMAVQHDDDADEDDDFFQSRRFQIIEVNHIGLIVSGVGKATDFCADVLGLQQVKRPNFDRHGAWFTGGNLEMHLIKGNPLVPKSSTKGSEANSISLKVNDLAAAIEVLAKKYAADESIMLEVEDDACYVRDPDGYIYKVHA